MTRRLSPWAYKIDYDKEIALDRKTIAWCDQVAPLSAAMPHAWKMLNFTPSQMAVAPEFASFFGLTDGGRLDLAKYLDIDCGRTLIDRPDGWYERGRAVHERISSEWGTEGVPDLARLKKMRSDAVAALARHRRNQAEFG